MNRFVLFVVRIILTPFFLVYLRMQRIGREHIPAEGPVILASNHRSFFDPFVIGTMTRRPVYYVAKKELFTYNRLLSWLVNALGAFPVDRGAGDQATIETAKVILGRGEIVLMFPEGTRTRPGALGTPRRGVGRLALETGAPVVPIAIIGTEDVRKGWRIRPRKVRLRAGPPLHFPKVDNASPAVAGAVTDRIWPMVMLQWEWLGGAAPGPPRGDHRRRRLGYERSRYCWRVPGSRSSSARARVSRPLRSPRHARTTPICRGSSSPRRCVWFALRSSSWARRISSA